MSESIRFEIVTPVRAVYSADALSAIVPTSLGEIEVLPEHQALLALVEHGTVVITEISGDQKVFVVQRGYTETLDDHVTLLVAGAKTVEEVDIEAARQALAEGEEALAGTTEISEEALTRARDRHAQARAEISFVERFA